MAIDPFLLYHGYNVIDYNSVNPEDRKLDGFTRPLAAGLLTGGPGDSTRVPG